MTTMPPIPVGALWVLVLFGGLAIFFLALLLIQLACVWTQAVRRFLDRCADGVR